MDAKLRRDGGYSTIEALVLVPIALVLVLGLVQLITFLLGGQAAQRAANNAALTGASVESSPQDGVARAEDWLAGQRLLQHSAVSADGSTAETVQVEVTGQVLTLLPGWDLTLSRGASQPVETPEP